MKSDDNAVCISRAHETLISSTISLETGVRYYWLDLVSFLSSSNILMRSDSS